MKKTVYTTPEMPYLADASEFGLYRDVELVPLHPMELKKSGVHQVEEAKDSTDVRDEKSIYTTSDVGCLVSRPNGEVKGMAQVPDMMDGGTYSPILPVNLVHHVSGPEASTSA